MNPPPATAHRIASIDALRGVAILGILYSIVDGFSGAGDAQLAAEQSSRGLIAWRIHEAFISQRCIAIFSFLFGLGLWQQWNRAIEHGRPYVAQHIRRMACLAMMGGLTTTFLFSAEILLVYAIIGMGLLALHRLNPPSSGAAVIAGIIYVALGPVWDLALMGPGAANAQAAFDQAYPPERIQSIYREGSLAESIALRWKAYQMIFYINGEWMRMALSLALIGYLAGRSGWGERLFKQPRAFGSKLVIPTLLGCLFMAAGLVGVPTYATIHEGPFYFIVSLGLITSVVAQIWLFALLANTKPGKVLLGVFSPVGRLSLTTYVGGAAVFAFVFQHYGLGLYGKLSYPAPTYIAVLTYIAFMAFAFVWLKRFRLGPLEWVWRRLSYRTEV